MLASTCVNETFGRSIRWKYSSRARVQLRPDLPVVRVEDRQRVAHRGFARYAASVSSTSFVASRPKRVRASAAISNASFRRGYVVGSPSPENAMSRTPRASGASALNGGAS